MRAPAGSSVLVGVLVLAVGGCSGTGTSSPVKTGAAAVVATGSTSRGPGATPRTKEWFAFQDSAFRIRLVRPDGTGEHPLDAATGGPEDNPDWSPDGKRLTFVGTGKDSNGEVGLWVINSDGTGLKKVVDCSDPCRYLDDPAWSPDGSEIMYSRLQPDTKTGGRLETVKLDGGQVRTLLTAKPGDFYSGVRYAPDGKAVVLEWVHATPESYDDVTGVTLMRVDLTARPAATLPLGNSDLWPETPDWSPQGDLIVYAALPSVGATAKDLYVIHPDGTGLRRLTTLADAQGGALHPDFTNDGTAVLFAGSNAGTTNFMMVDVTGQPAPTLTAGALSGHHPRTQPTP